MDITTAIQFTDITLRRRGCWVWSSACATNANVVLGPLVSIALVRGDVVRKHAPLSFPAAVRSPKEITPLRPEEGVLRIPDLPALRRIGNHGASIARKN